MSNVWPEKVVEQKFVAERTEGHLEALCFGTCVGYREKNSRNRTRLLILSLEHHPHTHNAHLPYFQRT